MIKTIAQIADVHIRKIPTRNEEYEKVFKNLITSLKEKKPDRIALVGDLVNDYLDLQGEQLILARNFLNSLANIAPTIVIRGNHDFRRKNKKRVDSVEAIVRVIDNPNIKYFNETGFYVDDNVTWVVWKHGESNNNPWRTKEGKKILQGDMSESTYIDLYHDIVNGCRSDSGLELKSKKFYKISDFKGHYSLLGDIHVKQYLNKEKTKAYCGSLLPQKFDEGDDNFHGYLLWNIVDKTTEEIEIKNDYSFKNVVITPFTDFDDLDIEIENPTKYMKIRILWKTNPDGRNNKNERKVKEHLKSKYKNITITDKNEFIEEEKMDVDEEVTIENIHDASVQHKVFEDFLTKLGCDENVIEEILALDEEISQKIELNDVFNVQWDVVKFGGKNFMSYESIEIDWRDMEGVFQIAGINTAGKTTIFKLISYVLYGKTLETEERIKFGDSRFLNNKTNLNYCEGFVVLDVNGEYYGIKKRTEVTRSKDGEINGSPTTMEYHILQSPDDEISEETSIENLNEDQRNPTQKKIEGIIGTYDNFNRIVLTTSDTINRVLSNNMADFVDSLLFDSGLDLFDKKLTEIKKHEKKVNEKSRITCNVQKTKEENEVLNSEIVVVEKEIEVIETVKLEEIKDKIKIGENYISDLTKKLFQIDQEIVNLNVDDVNEEINEFKQEINDYEERKSVIEEAIKPLQETYDEEKLNQLLEKKESHKQKEYNHKIEIKSLEQEIDAEKHKIEIVNGKIFNLKKDGGKLKEEIVELKKSKTCGWCGQKIDKQEHQEHINKNVKLKEDEMYKIGDDIKSHQNTIDDIHKPKIEELENNIGKINKQIETLSNEMEVVLVDIGKLTNEKNDVEKRKELVGELNQIPTKLQNCELKIQLLKDKIKKFEDSKKQIESNEKVEKGIKLAKEKLQTLNNEKDELNETLLIKKNNITEKSLKIKENEKLLKDFEEQEHRDYIINLYKKCVHRDGIPRQLLVTNIIPKVNKEMSDTLSTMPFKVWLDIDDLKLKLAYNNAPDAVINAIGSSGKERTFAAIVLKAGLNQINVKSKPLILLLDEVTGKLTDESMEEFIELLHVLKSRMKRILIVEYKYELNPDYLINVERDEMGISTLTLE